MKKILALLLALLMVAGTLSLVACGDKNPDNGKKDDPAVDPAQDPGSDPGTAPADPGTDPVDPGTDPVDPGTDPVDPVNPEEDPNRKYWDNLPEKMDFGGDTIRFIGHSLGGMILPNRENINEGDAVEMAMYMRELEVEDRLNVALDYLEELDYSGVTASKLGLDVTSGSGDYDIVTGHMKFDCNAALQGYCLNLNKLTNIDLTRDYWNQRYTEVWGYKTINPWTTGDITYTFIALMMGLFVNATEFVQAYPDADLFKLVEDGKWTLENLAVYANNFSKDMDGDGAVTEIDANGKYVDMFGLAFRSNWVEASFCYGAGISIAQKSGSKYVVKLATPENEAIYAKLKAVYDSPNTRKSDTYPGLDTNLFVVMEISAMAELREAPYEYWVLPLAKASEEDDYHTPSYDGVPLVGVDAIVAQERYDEIGAVMEALAANGKKYLTPAYFEIALQSKYARNEGTMRCLSIIRDHGWCDFGFAWCNFLSGLDTMAGDGLIHGIASMSAMEASHGATIEAGVNKLYTQYNTLLKKEK